MQLNFFDLKTNNKFRLKELKLSNYRRIHEDNVITLKTGINLIMPHYSDEPDYELRRGIDFEVFEENVDTLYMKDFLQTIEILKCKENFELWDYSFFGENKTIEISAIVEQNHTNREFIRRQKYRGEEMFGEIIGVTKSNKPKVLKMDKDFFKENAIDNLLGDIAIYPKELPPLLRVEYTKNFDYLTEKFPLLDVKQFIKDANDILNLYSITCHFEVKGDNVIIVKERYVDTLINEDKKFKKTFNNLEEILDPLTMDILFNTSHKYANKHLEIAMIIALEKQFKNNVIVFSQGFLQGIYDDELELALLMLVEFVNNGQQIVLMYNNPYNSTMMDFIEETAKSYNEKIGLDLYNFSWFSERHTSIEEWSNKSITIQARELIGRQELPYLEKKKLSKKIIREAISSKVKDLSKLAIGFSYGKDSLCLLLLIKETIDDMNEIRDKDSKIPYPTLVFCNTGVEFPETYSYKLELDKILIEWGFKIACTKPLDRFWNIVEKRGFPMFGKAIRKKKNPELFDKIQKLGIRTCGNKCCELLKEEPSRIFYEENHFELVFVGILAEESYMRKMRWYGLGDTYWNNTENIYKSQPLIHYSEDDIWTGIKESGVIYNPIYDKGYWSTDSEGNETFIKYKRSGCWCCSMNIQFEGNNMEMLRNTHPKLWDLIMNKKGLAKEIFKFKHGIDENNWTESEKFMLQRYLESKPCHFDSTEWSLNK